MKILLNPQYATLRPFVENLSANFRLSQSTTLHEGRNTVKLFTIDGLPIVVKSYGHLSLVNRAIYGILRKSKGMRAYLYAGRLRRLGIDTPEEIAVVEIRHRGLLRENYFVSLYSDLRPLPSVTEANPPHPETQPILDALADFLLRLHRAGVLHKDLNIGNMLYRPDGKGGYEFQLIDINRMSFHQALSMRQRIKNLRRLSCAPITYMYLIYRYAEKTGGDEISSIQFKGILARLLFEAKRGVKQKIKAIRNRFHF